SSSKIGRHCRSSFLRNPYAASFLCTTLRKCRRFWSASYSVSFTQTVSVGRQVLSVRVTACGLFQFLLRQNSNRASRSSIVSCLLKSFLYVCVCPAHCGRHVFTYI